MLCNFRQDIPIFVYLSVTHYIGIMSPIYCVHLYIYHHYIADIYVHKRDIFQVLVKRSLHIYDLYSRKNIVDEETFKWFTIPYWKRKMLLFEDFTSEVKDILFWQNAFGAYIADIYYVLNVFEQIMIDYICSPLYS